MNPEYSPYFKSIATNHKLIGHTDEEPHFTHVEMGELDSSVVVTLKPIILAITSPRYQATANHANLRWELSGSLFILDKLDDQYDFAEAQQLIEKCRGIAEDIQAKMIKDRKDWNAAAKQHVLPGLDENGFMIAPLHYEWRPMLGVMMTFKWNVPRAPFDTAKWNNETPHRL